MRRIPRVLHIIPYFQPAYGFGGPVAVSELLVSGLRQRGLEVAVWTTDVKAPEGDRVTVRDTCDAKTTVRRYHYFLRPIFRKANLLVTPRMGIDALVEENPPDLIHLHEFRSFQAVCAYTMAQRCNIPLILQPHGTLRIALGKTRAKTAYDWLFGKRLLRKASRIVALSPQEAEACQSLGIPESKVTIIPNGVTLPELPPSTLRGHFRAKHGISSSDFIILFLGRIRTSKGVGLLLDAFEDFSRSFPESVLAVCGPDDGAGNVVREAVAVRGLKVIMTGTLVGREKSEALADSDMFCLPSGFETQSVALLEAASFGIPIVASSDNAPLEFVHANAGLFVHLDRGSLADAFARLVSSPGLRKEIGLRARSTVEQYFSEKSMLGRFSALYSGILSETWNPLRVEGV